MYAFILLTKTRNILKSTKDKKQRHDTEDRELDKEQRLETGDRNRETGDRGRETKDRDVGQETVYV